MKLSIARSLRRLASECLAVSLGTVVNLRWALQRRRRVALTEATESEQVIISLTSFSARFATLPLTLKCLLLQSWQPARVVLWIGHKDRANLPQDVLDLQPFGLEIRYCDDIKSYTKIIPSLEAFPQSGIVVADDDVYYHADWLRELVLAQRAENGAPTIVCHRGHKIILAADGRPAPYREWAYEAADVGLASPLTFATGVGGVYYRPGDLHPDTVRQELFLIMSPSADDVWLYWMARKNGRSFKVVSKPRRVVSWRGSQDIALNAINVNAGDGNDRAISALEKAYGWPS